MVDDEIRTPAGSFRMSVYVTPDDTHTGRRAVALVFDGDAIVAESCFLANDAVNEAGDRLYPGDDVYEVHPFVTPAYRRMGVHSAMIDWFERRFHCVVRPSSPWIPMAPPTSGEAAAWNESDEGEQEMTNVAVTGVRAIMVVTNRDPSTFSIVSKERVEIEAVDEDSLLALYFREYQNRYKYCNNVSHDLEDVALQEKYKVWISDVRNYAANGGDMW